MELTVEVVAHRGASAYAAEHTFAAYDLAIAMGADSLELDVRATRDGRLVVLHDPTLERTAGDPRAIAEVDARELPASAPPPALDDVLARYGAATRWLVELKDPTPALEASVADALRRHRLAGRATVQSFDPRSLRRLRRRAPELHVAPLMCETWDSARIIAAMRRAARYACAVGVFHEAVDPAVVQAARSHGLMLRAYTVNDAVAMARLIDLGTDALITDAPDVAVAAIEARQAPAAAA